MNCADNGTKEHCSCTCEGCLKRHNCCQCVAYHQKRGEIPGCFFSPEGERSYDRSFENFIRDRQREI